MTGFFEHHTEIRKNKLCPFKLRLADSSLSSPCNWHNNVEIILTVSGRGAMQYASDRLELEKNDIVVVNSDTIHQLHCFPDFSFYYLIIDEKFCRENGLDMTATLFERKFKDKTTAKRFLDVVTSYENYAHDDSPISVALLRNAVLSLVIDLCANHLSTDRLSPHNATPSEEYVKKVLERINSNCAEHISLDLLASECGITKCYLSREFKRYTGQTVFTYINTLRCKKAELCIRNGATITEAAYESGFESLSYFSRVYKKLMGVPPSEAKPPER